MLAGLSTISLNTLYDLLLRYWVALGNRIKDLAHRSWGASTWSKAVAVVCGCVVAGVLLLMPISGNFARYLWWRYTADPGPETGSVDTEGAAIHYQHYRGRGPAILLLHGGLSHRLSWFSQLPWLVSSGRGIVVIDIRGHGRSGLGERALSYLRLASDVLAVMDALHLPKADIIGWSDGGNTALVLAHRWRKRVERIVAISANYDPSGLTEDARADAARPSSHRSPASADASISLVCVASCSSIR